jgi:formylglycine-generating enzyme required for sulfatase activity
MIATLITSLLILTPQEAAYVEKIPGSLVEFTMIRVPEKGIWIGETEVTWNLFDIWAFRLDLSDKEVADGVDAESRPSRPYGAADWGFGRSGYPAIGMTHFAAEEFCKWLSKKTGKRYRLPTEEEWEFAARAGVSSEPSDLESVAWYWENSDDKTHPVKSKKPNAWGLYDMLGNVAEWAIDEDGKALVCGGSWKDKVVGFKVRSRQEPKWNERDPQNPKSKWWLSDAPFVGFRVVCEN